MWSTIIYYQPAWTTVLMLVYSSTVYTSAYLYGQLEKAQVPWSAEGRYFISWSLPGTVGGVKESLVLSLLRSCWLWSWLMAILADCGYSVRTTYSILCTYSVVTVRSMKIRQACNLLGFVLFEIAGSTQSVLTVEDEVIHTTTGGWVTTTRRQR